MLGSGPDTHPLSNMLTREHKLLSTPAGATSLLPDVPCNTKTAQQPYLLQTLQISLCSRPANMHSGCAVVYKPLLPCRCTVRQREVPGSRQPGRSGVCDPWSGKVPDLSGTHMLTVTAGCGLHPTASSLHFAHVPASLTPARTLCLCFLSCECLCPRSLLFPGPPPAPGQALQLSLLLDCRPGLAGSSASCLGWMSATPGGLSR